MREISGIEKKQKPPLGPISYPHQMFEEADFCLYCGKKEAEWGALENCQVKKMLWEKYYLTDSIYLSQESTQKFHIQKAYEFSQILGKEAYRFVCAILWQSIIPGVL